MQQRRQTLRRFLTTAQCCEAYPAFSMNALRWLLFRRTESGLSAAVLRVGPRRLLIDARAFEAWLLEHREQRGTPDHPQNQAGA